ncbi:MAG: NfeD family protein [Rhizobiaceae bacterium]
MIEQLTTELGPWNWMVLGLILLGAEVLVPGFFLIWIGIAAVIVGALSLALWDAAMWTWQMQVLVFLALALVSAFAGRALTRRGEVSDEPLLNKRSAQMIGKTATLEEAIVNGQGRVKIGDTTWSVSGPDLEAGTRVKVTGAADMKLTVEPA